MSLGSIREKPVSTVMSVATSHNTANNDTPFVERDYCGRSMPFGAKKIDLLIGAKRHGVVCRDVVRHVRPPQHRKNILRVRAARGLRIVGWCRHQESASYPGWRGRSSTAHNTPHNDVCFIIVGWCAAKCKRTGSWNCNRFGVV